MSFSKRLIDVQFTLGNGKTFDGGKDTLTLKGLRSSIKVLKAGGASYGQLQAAIFGMTKSHMNTLSTLGQKVYTVNSDEVTILAGTADRGLTVVFKGNIFNAYADLNGEVAFIVTAQAEYASTVVKTPPSSFKGGVDVATVIESLTKQMGLKFENNGVNVQLASPYFSGSAGNQVQQAVIAANISYFIDNGVLSIWPRTGSRNIDDVPVISPKTGMKGYPSYTADGIVVETMFNPSIQFGGKVKIESDQKPANGEWTVYSMEYDLAAETPGGPWFMRLGIYKPDGGVVVPK